MYFTPCRAAAAVNGLCAARHTVRIVAMLYGGSRAFEDRHQLYTAAVDFILRW